MKKFSKVLNVFSIIFCIVIIVSVFIFNIFINGVYFNGYVVLILLFMFLNPIALVLSIYMFLQLDTFGINIYKKHQFCLMLFVCRWSIFWSCLCLNKPKITKKFINIFCKNINIKAFKYKALTLNSFIF